MDELVPLSKVCGYGGDLDVQLQSFATSSMGFASSTGSHSLPLIANSALYSSVNSKPRRTITKSFEELNEEECMLLFKAYCMGGSLTMASLLLPTISKACIGKIFKSPAFLSFVQTQNLLQLDRTLHRQEDLAHLSSEEVTASRDDKEGHVATNKRRQPASTRPTSKKKKSDVSSPIREAVISSPISSPGSSSLEHRRRMMDSFLDAQNNDDWSTVPR